MTAARDPHRIADIAALEALFGIVGEASLRKETDRLHPVYRQWIERAPFAVLATVGADGLDASPRGDPAPLVTIVDECTMRLPERRGNNRIDSLRNIVRDPRVALLFLIPGVGETLRVNGRASITVDPALLERHAMAGQRPQCIVEIKVEAVFFQCARALKRSALWSDATPADVPTAGAMLEALTANGGATIDGADYDRDLPERQRATLY